MNIRREVAALRNHFWLWAVLFVLVTIVFCTATIAFKVHNSGYILPSFSTEKGSLSSQFFLKAQKDLVPKGVEIISISPLTAFLVKVKISLLGSFVVLFPYLLYSIVSYLSPALYPKERMKLILVSFFSMALFVSGMFFSYKLLVENMFSSLFSFNFDLGITPFLSAEEFISWTLSALLITGTLFLLPIFMYMLTLAGIVKHTFWKSKWREAFVVFLVATSIVTPDVSGISVIFLTFPGAGLYFSGMVLSTIHASSVQNKKRRK